MEIKTSMQKLIGPYAQQVQKQQPDKQPGSAQAAQVQPTGDRVSVSPQARLYTEAYSAAVSAPEVRQEKVAALKSQVENGTYQIDSRKIAANLLEGELAINESLEG